MDNNVKLAAIDGTDALAFVIIRPGTTEGGVSIEAAANGMGKEQAAYVLRHVANEFDANTPSGQSSVDPQAALTVLTDLAERWERMGKAAPEMGDGLFIDEPTRTQTAQYERAATYRKAAADLREVLATGRIPHDLMTDAELDG